MKKLCCEEDLELCHELKARLEEKGIACVVKHEGQDLLLGGNRPLVGSTLPEVWIADDNRFEEACRIAARESGPAMPDSESEPDEEQE